MEKVADANKQNEVRNFFIGIGNWAMPMVVAWQSWKERETGINH